MTPFTFTPFLTTLQNTLISLGKALLNLIPQKTIIPIVFGPSRGFKWIRGSGCHSYWLGTYEYPKNVLFGNSIRSKQIVYDVGAHVGYYTLIASIKVGKQGHVYAFEPNPRNYQYLNKQLRLNKLSNVTTLKLAISNTLGTAKFIKDPSDLMGRIDNAGSKIVTTTTLDHLVKHQIIKPPDIIKIDAEGAEFLILKGARHLLSQYHPEIFLATHDLYYQPKTHQQCCQLLTNAGYSLTPIDTKIIATSQDIYAVHPQI